MREPVGRVQGAHLRDGDPQRARVILSEALSLWRDAPLSGVSALGRQAFRN